MSKLLKFKFLLLISLYSFFNMTGCISGGIASTKIRFTQSHFPISMSRSLRDQDNKLIELKQLKNLGQFKRKWTSWSLLYGNIPLTHSKDLSKAINKNLKEINADGIINFKITARTCGFTQVPLFSLLPIWPGCVHISVKGDMVNIKHKKVVLVKKKSDKQREKGSV